jgi:hypothetical protein
VQEQRREERAVLAPRQVDRLPAVQRFERAEDSEFHLPGVSTPCRAQLEEGV